MMPRVTSAATVDEHHVKTISIYAISCIRILSTFSELNFKGALNVIHELSEHEQDKNENFSCSSFSMACQPPKMATHPFIADTLN
jgi:hypothetical protein